MRRVHYGATGSLVARNEVLVLAEALWLGFGLYLVYACAPLDYSVL